MGKNLLIIDIHRLHDFSYNSCPIHQIPEFYPKSIYQPRFYQYRACYQNTKELFDLTLSFYLCSWLIQQLAKNDKKSADVLFLSKKEMVQEVPVAHLIF